MTFLLLGEAPNPATVGRPELWLLPDDSGVPHTANRLRELSRYSHREYRLVFPVRRNVLPEIPASWNLETRRLAREGAESALEVCQRLKLRGVVCLGRRAMDAMQAVCAKPIAFYWTAAQVMTDLEPIPCVYVPHTSGRNLWWNEPSNQRDACRFFLALLETAEKNQ